ncbi:MAG: GGDEF domain-containing protein [Pseudomonas sp.]|nr:GGDEF domain-containing protein [Pseudomonas sp.]
MGSKWLLPWVLALVALAPACAVDAGDDDRVPITRIERLAVPTVARTDEAEFAEVRGAPEAAWSGSDGAAQLAGAVDGAGWWRVHPGAGDGPLELLVYHPFSAELVVLAPPDYRPQRASIFDRSGNTGHSRRTLAFELAEPGPAYVRARAARYPLQVAVMPSDAHHAENHRHVRVLWMSVGLLLGIALVVLLFWSRLRERMYLLFAASVALQLLYVLMAYGDAYTLAGIDRLARFGVEGIWFVATASTIVTVLFLLDFAALRTGSPWLARALWVVGVLAPSLLLVALVAPLPSDKSWFPPLGNGLLLLANALAIATLLRVWLRGGRYAGYVLIGWVPLVIVSTARAVQLSAGVPLAPWLEYGLPVMQVFAAMVLLLGLADRMLTFRRERDAAQADADHDALTGVLNRGGLLRQLDRALLDARRERLPLSVLFLDLDHFKQVNDTWGHPVGDDCLRRVTEVVRAQADDEGGQVLGRIGGEEFVLLLPRHGRRHARDVAERIRLEVVEACRQVRDAPVALTLSVGVAEARPDDTVAALLERADAAMYRAKGEGRNRVVVVEDAPR